MERDLNRLSRNEYDLVVVGGGIYGVCAAWDAAHRGLSVALVERGDFVSATSASLVSNSTIDWAAAAAFSAESPRRASMFVMCAAY